MRRHRTTRSVHGRGIALGQLRPGLATESVRHAMSRALGEESAAATIEEWDAIVTEYGQSYISAPPAEVLAGLVIDVLALRDVIREQDDVAGVRELCRVGACLAAVTAMTTANLGEGRQARRWWRNARQLARDSGDRDTVLWVRGCEVVRALYERSSAAEVLRLVADAERYVTPETPATAVLELYSGKAQALALAGRRADAEAALRYFRDVLLPAVPAAVAEDRESMFGWPEVRLRFTESFVYSFLGDDRRARAAQDRAALLYPAWFPRGRAQIELQRALCLVGRGDVVDAVRHAHTVMTDLQADQHIRPLVDLGRRVLDAVPPADRGRPEVADFAEYLASCPATYSDVEHP